MQHHHQVAVLFQGPCHPVLHHRRGLAGRPAEEVAVWVPGGQRNQPFIARLRILLIPLLGRSCRIDHHGRVVNDRWIAGSELPRFDVTPRRYPNRNHEITDPVGSARRQSVGVGHFDDQVGRPQRPVVGPFRRRRQCRRVAKRSALICPPDDGGDLLISEAPARDKFAVSGLGLPRRHRATLDGCRDTLRARPCLCKSQHAERRRAPRTMARRALLKENRRDVFGERDRRWSRSTLGCRRNPQDSRRQAQVLAHQN